MQRAFVHEDSVIALAVITERLAVIAGDDDDRPIEQFPAIEGVQQPPDLRVGERDLAEYGSVYLDRNGSGGS